MCIKTVYIIFAMECNFSFIGGGVEFVVTLLISILLKCHKYFAVSGFNLIREYINRDLLTAIWNTFLYYNYVVHTTLLGA